MSRAASWDAEPVGRRGFLLGLGLAGIAAFLAACGQTGPGPVASSLGPSPSVGASGAPSPSPSPASTGPTPRQSPAPIQPRPPDNPVAAENQRRGSRAWDARRSGTVEAYLGVASVAPGGALSLRASGGGDTDVEWYRLGWYGGLGGRLLGTDRGVAIARQPIPTPDPVTGLVEAGWPAVLTTTAPTDAPSGMLLAVLRTRDGTVTANAPVVLRPDPVNERRAPVLFVSAAATWQAYNDWGGLDLYGNASGHAVSATGGRRAAAVSFDRPYALDGGAGYLRRWELQFIRWMERAGRDVEYAADVDLELDPGLVRGRRLVVMAGHPEYWSRPMRATVEAAVATGVNVAFLTANEVYWQARLEDGPAGRASRIVCYKSALLDPLTATRPALATCRWREPPVSDPEATLVGQMYGSIVRQPGDWVVSAPSHWLYEGTLLAAGDRIRNLVGQEYDTFVAALAQPDTTILARGPVDRQPRVSRSPGPFASQPIHTATVYPAVSGATVLAAGTFQWSWAIDRYGARAYKGRATPFDPRVVRMTANLFDRLGDGPLAP